MTTSTFVCKKVISVVDMRAYGSDKFLWFGDEVGWGSRKYDLRLDVADPSLPRNRYPTELFEVKSEIYYKSFVANSTCVLENFRCEYLSTVGIFDWF